MTALLAEGFYIGGGLVIVVLVVIFRLRVFR